MIGLPSNTRYIYFKHLRYYAYYYKANLNNLTAQNASMVTCVLLQCTARCNIATMKLYFIFIPEIR